MRDGLANHCREGPSLETDVRLRQEASQSGAGCGNNAFRPHAWRIVREGGKATQDKQVTCDTGIAGLTQGIRLSVFTVYVIHKVLRKLGGRPPKPVRDRQSHLIALRLKPAEFKTLEQAARKAGLTVSEYVRQTLGLRNKSK
jgi:hypothetical protein